MNCPLCHDRALVPHHRSGIEIDVCPHCGGVWLDRNELDRLLSVAPGPASAGPAPSARPVERQPVRSDAGADRDRRPERPSKGAKKRKKKGWADRLGDALEDVLDL
ncbi:MAG: zf-TFIIB domain-containing protein [Acidimicrobiales bacterium]